jgi:hypothetical protein
VGHTDANRHALLNTRKLPVYSTCRLCQQTQTLNLLVVVQWRQYAPLIRRSTIILHGSTTQKTALNIILAAVRT